MIQTGIYSIIPPIIAIVLALITIVTMICQTDPTGTTLILNKKL